MCILDLSVEGLPSGPYGVRAVAGGQSSPTHTFVRAEATRYPAPAALTASVTGLGVQLAWTAPASTMPASYRVSRRVNGGASQLLDPGAGPTLIQPRAPPGAVSHYQVA